MPVSPVFIFSLPRSGSTLLQRMLATHEDIYTHSELWFLLPHVEALRNQYSFSWYSNRSLGNATRGLLDQLPNGKDDYYRAIRALGDSLYASLAKNNEKYVLDKTPRYYLIIEDIEKIYPDSKFIFLFRNPLSVAASVVESFNKGRLGDFCHKIDLYLGPERLAEGYRALKDRSIALQYEKLVSDPYASLKEVCEYLEIPFHEKLVTGFSTVPVGALGDQFGSVRFNTLEPDRSENWQTVFATSFRKKHLLRYLNEIGKEIVEEFGYDFDALQKKIENLNVRSGMSMSDRLDLIKSGIMSVFEGVYFREKIIRHGRISKHIFPIH